MKRTNYELFFSYFSSVTYFKSEMYGYEHIINAFIYRADF